VNSEIFLMKKSQAKTKLSIYTPNPQKSVATEPSPAISYVKLQKQNNRYNQALRSIASARQDTFSSPITVTQKAPISQTPNATSNRILFFKSKAGMSSGQNQSSKENLQPNLYHLPAPFLERAYTEEKLERHDTSISGGSVHTPTKFTLERPVFEVNNRKPSPGHVKSNSTNRPLQSNRYQNGNGKSTPTHPAKTLSVSSAECLLKNNFLASNSSLFGSRVLNLGSRELTESSDRGSKGNIIPPSERCANHPHKRAKYYAISESEESDNVSKYCSKCAILLAQNGVKVQEILPNDESLRKSEIEEFLIKLSNTKKELNNFSSSLLRKKEDLLTYFEKQHEKANLVYEALENLIREEKKKCIDTLSLNQQGVIEEIGKVEQEIANGLTEISHIQTDIEKNINDIIKNIELEPFKNVIKRYDSRLKSFEEAVNKFKDQHLTIHRLQSFNHKGLEKLRPIFANFYSLMKLNTSIIKKSEGPEEIAKPAADGKTLPITKSSLYISFENKEMFENAMNNEQPSRRCSDLYSYAYTTSDSRIDASNNKLNTTMPCIPAHSRSNDDPRIKKAGIDLEEFMGKETIKTPREKRFGNFVCMTSVTKHTNNTTSHMSGTIQEENEGSEKDHLLMSTFSEKEFSAADSPTENKENNPPQNVLSQDGKGKLGSQKSTKKYISILDKISANQSKKSIYYSNMLKSNPLISPRYVTQEDEETIDAEETLLNKSERYTSKLRENNTITSAFEANDVKSYNCTQENKTEHPAKEVKNNPNLVFFIENQINNEKQNPASSNYQKTLFCSPNFKDNIQPQETDFS